MRRGFVEEGGSRLVAERVVGGLDACTFVEVVVPVESQHAEAATSALRRALARLAHATLVLHCTSPACLVSREFASSFGKRLTALSFPTPLVGAGPLATTPFALGNVAVVGGGRLVVAVDALTYQRLGLQGRKTSHAHAHAVVHEVVVELASIANERPGDGNDGDDGDKKRVRWCLERLGPLRLLAHVRNDDDNDDNNDNDRQRLDGCEGVHTEQSPAKATTASLPPVLLPSFAALLQTAGAQGLTASDANALWAWCGVVAARQASLLEADELSGALAPEDSAPSFHLADLLRPALRAPASVPCQCLRLDGVVGAASVTPLLQAAADVVLGAWGVPFVCLAVRGLKGRAKVACAVFVVRGGWTVTLEHADQPC